jgi:hypothetical protein
MKNLIPVFNSSELLPMADANLPAGEIGLANEARLESRYYSEALTTYIQGWRDPNNIEDTLNFLAPPVQVGRRFEFKKWDNADDFLSETDDERAIGSAFKRVDYKGTSSTDKTLNKGLTFRADRDEYQEVPGWRELIVGRLKQRILRNELRRVVTAIAAAANNTAKTWDTTAGKDPDQDVLTELIAAVDASGIRPNRLLYGEVAWNKRALAHRAQDTAGGYASAGLTPAQVAGFLGVDEIKLSRERYQSAAATKSKVVPDIVLFFYALNSPTIEDPSHCKRFWSPVEGGGMFRVFEQEVGSKFTDITVEHYSKAVVLTSLGLRKFTIS